MWQISMSLWLSSFFFNPFVPKVPFLYPLKTSENRKVFWCFQGVEKGCIGNKRVKLDIFSTDLEFVEEVHNISTSHLWLIVEQMQRKFQRQYGFSIWIYSANPLTGFYMKRTLVVKGSICPAKEYFQTYIITCWQNNARD